ncbi:MAG: hybrid sensor histidine kinase/response regulator, partial [Massilia sp.]|nr:hybrid sensor histidine kinase/response regulator [Massilia sp.]
PGVATPGVATPAAAAPLRLRGHILLAEDGIDNQRLIGAFLGSVGLTHEAVDNGSSAVELAASGRFDLVLMDIRMPVMDGVTATGLLRAQGFGKPIVALTADLMQGDAARHAAAGFDRSIGKPVDFAALSEAIALLLGQAAPAAADARAAIDGLDEIRAWFNASLAPRLTELAALVDSGAWKQAAHLAHQLRGAGGSFGYPGLSRCARVLETAADQGDAGAVRAALDDLLALEELRELGAGAVAWPAQ